MSLRPILLTALAAAGSWQGFNNWQLRPVHPADGPIAPADGCRGGTGHDARSLAPHTPSALRHHGADPRSRGQSLRWALRSHTRGPGTRMGTGTWSTGCGMMVRISTPR